MTTKNTRNNRTQRNARATQSHATFDTNIDYDDVDNVNRDANAIDASMIETTNANQIVTLKHIIETRKIKCDPKLIRRVLRKYYALKNNHQLRDAWTFNVSQIDDVVKLIDTHCRAGKSSTNAS